jgi:AraC-like DNA-binding protein
MNTNIADCCALFYRSTAIPIASYSLSGECEFEYPLEPSRLPLAMALPSTFNKNPEIYHSPSHGCYGYVLVPGEGQVIWGPVYNVPISKALVHAFMQENYISIDQQEQASNLLLATPTISFSQFLNKLILLHYCLNGEIIDPSEHFDMKNTSQMPQLEAKNIQQMMETKETQQFHNTYHWEQHFFHLIREGEPEKLSEFLEISNSLGFKIGVLADAPLRQAKNLFIGMIVKVGTLCGIPGGLDVELTYQLIDSYTQECERTSSILEIDRLQYTMIFDFCRRIATSRVPKDISQEVYTCMCYIREHTNERIRIVDVAQHINRSISYTFNKFKRETGSNIGTYITHCKLEDAANLLIYSQNSLSKISSYLCFSSQSYFQNIFKKKYGVTPMQYRRQHHI